MKRIIKALSYTVLSGIVVCLGAYADAEEQYQAEVGGFYSQAESGDGYESTAFGASAEVFFSPVKTAGHAYAEAAFLERAGSLFVMAAQLESEWGSLESDGPFFEVGVNYAKPGFPVAIQATYSRIDIDYTHPSYTGEGTGNLYGLSVGNYILDNLMAGLSYNYSKFDYEYTLFGSSTSKVSEYGLFAKYVHGLGGDQELNLEAVLGQEKVKGETDTDKNTILSLFADYYFNRSLSVGLGFENNSGDDESAEGNTYSANVNYFFTPRFSVNIGHDRFSSSNDGEDNSRGFSLLAAARF